MIAPVWLKKEEKKNAITMEIRSQERRICEFSCLWKCSLLKILTAIFFFCWDSNKQNCRSVPGAEGEGEGLCLMTNRLCGVGFSSSDSEEMLNVFILVPAGSLNSAVLMIQSIETVLCANPTISPLVFLQMGT